MDINIKKVLIGLLVIIILFFLSVIFFLKNEKLSIKKFEPFSENNVLIKMETSLVLEDDLPKIEAASAFYPLAANIVQNIYNKEVYSKKLLQMVSTSQAFDDIINGETDCIIATEPSDEQKEKIQNSSIDLEFKTIYLEPLVIFLNKNNDINNLSIEQIQKIYNNSDLNWKEFGKNEGIIHTYQLEKNNGSQTCFESIVNSNKIENNHFEIRTMPEIIDKVALDKKGIGYAFNSYYSKMYINKNTKKIKVDDKEITNKEYPLQFEVYLIYRKDNQNKNISKIANWLKTEEGINMIEKIK